MRKPRLLCLKVTAVGFYMKLKERGNDQSADNERAKGNSIPSKGGKGMLSYEVHQKLDRQHRNGESDNAADDKIADFRGGHCRAFDNKTEDFIRARADHGRDCKDKGEFRSRRSVHAKEQCAENGNTRARSAGDCRQQLKTTDIKSGFTVSW